MIDQFYGEGCIRGIWKGRSTIRVSEASPEEKRGTRARRARVPSFDEGRAERSRTTQGKSKNGRFHRKMVKIGCFLLERGLRMTVFCRKMTKNGYFTSKIGQNGHFSSKMTKIIRFH